MDSIGIKNKLHCTGKSLLEALENAEYPDLFRVEINANTIAALLSISEGNIRRKAFKKSSNKYVEKLQKWSCKLPGYDDEYVFRPSQTVIIVDEEGVLVRGMHTCEVIAGLLAGEKGEEGVEAVSGKIVSVSVDLVGSDAAESDTKNQGKQNEAKLMAPRIDSTENQVINARELLESICYAFSKRGRSATNVGSIGAAKLQNRYPELFERLNDEKAIGIRDDRKTGETIRRLRPSLQGLAVVFCDLLGIDRSEVDSIFLPLGPLNLQDDEWRVKQKAAIKNELTKLDKEMRRSKKEGGADGNGKGTIREEASRILELCLNIKRGELNVNRITPSRYTRLGIKEDSRGMTPELVSFVKWVCKEFTDGPVRDKNATLDD